MQENSTLLPKFNVSLLEDLNAETAKLLLPVTISLSVLGTVGVVGNSLVLYIWIAKLGKSTSNTCVLLLASLDMVVCTFGIPMEIYKLTNQFYFDKPVVCKTFRFLVDFSVNSSIAVLLLLACTRYYAVCKPLKVFPLESRRIPLLCVCAGACLSWPVLVLHGMQTKTTRYNDINGVDCGIDEAFANSKFPNIYFSVLGLVFVICVILLSGLYASIAVTLYGRNRRKAYRTRGIRVGCWRNPCYKSRTSQKTDEPDVDVKLNKLFFSITLVFVLSFLPSLAMLAIKASIVQIERTLSDLVYVGYIFCFKTYLINSCVNPVLYGFMNRHFQIECKKLFTVIRGRIFGVDNTFVTKPAK